MPTNFWFILIIGIALILTFDTLGAIASRKFNFNFSKVSILSLFIFLGISIWATKTINATAGISIAGLLSLVDATLGWRLFNHFNPNLGELESTFTEEAQDGKDLKPSFVFGMVLFGLFVGWLGTWLA